MKLIQFVVDSKAARIDSFLAVKMKAFTRSEIQKMCTNGFVYVNDIAVLKSHRVNSGDIVTVKLPAENSEEILPENIPLNILYQDDYLAVINKPKGMLVHPTHHEHSGTLVNALLYHFDGNLSTIGEDYRPGIVHRLDKDTSGLLVVALDNNTHKSLTHDIQMNKVSRKYKAVVYGNVKTEDGVITAPIGRDPRYRTRMAVLKDGRNAETLYKVAQRYSEFTLLELELRTGRTHQIRVHMSYINHPLAGDALYGPKKVIRSLNGQCLHAYEISFVHPESKQAMTFTDEMPEYFENFINKINNV